jgi:hypothetical protein
MASSLEEAKEQGVCRLSPGRETHGANRETSDPLVAAAELSLHPQAARVAEMSSAEYAALLADIRVRGLLTPLEVTSAGIVLDGRARLAAARELGLALVPIRIVAPDDEVCYMVLAAVQRRQLSASQKAAHVLELDEYKLAKEDARRRRLANLKSQPEVATLPPRGKTRELGALWGAKISVLPANREFLGARTEF